MTDLTEWQHLVDTVADRPLRNSVGAIESVTSSVDAMCALTVGNQSRFCGY